MINCAKNMPWFLSLLTLLVVSLCTVSAHIEAAEPLVLVIGPFSNADLTGWEAKEFNGKTDYKLIFDKHLQQSVVQAQSHASASGLYREIIVDLTATPFLNWSWRVDTLLQGHDERSKQGDDFSARIYVVKSGGALFWQTRSLVYVWSSQQAENSQWHNPYTAQARHIVVQAGNQQLGEWVAEKRDVRADFVRLFGDQIDQIDAVAIMTDTDNTGQQASALYGDIFFTKD